MHLALNPPGTVGLWTNGIDLRSPAESADAAAEIESLGYRALWLSEGLVRDPFIEAFTLLSATRSLVVGTGIAVIWGRHPRHIRSMTRALDDSHHNRFVLGLGASHAAVVEGGLGIRYERPLSALREHVQELDAPDPILTLAAITRQEAKPVPRLLAALGPKALGLARDHAAGAFSYLVTPEHTARARSILGPDRVLVVEQAVVVGTDTADARARARGHVSAYLNGRPYQANLRRLGFAEADFAEGGSDRLVESLVAIGESQVADRVDAHFTAGASHVCLQALPARPADLPVDQWRTLAPLATSAERT
ncbi:TIGR03620 family F420-dependent LLM class oxidoreductase [Saccharomonospora piscinae]|uniref:TIGR03620 family F420-dependent LLM class oxidoreductase n=1 Tax=Saccharomonospora piscinae TaxID=687388 RepID=UPI0004B2E1DD|nr:TIGR03620 family F420-dependent LLM class oxidoreductase [Saccharomonospora piscinae]